MPIVAQVQNVVGARSLRFDGQRVRVGRGASCDLRLPDGSISTHHATLSRRGHQWLLIDEGSTNGTFVGAVRLAAGAPRILAGRELVRLGRLWVELTITADEGELADAETTRELALALVAARHRREPVSAPVRVCVVDGPGRGRELVLDEGQTAIVGRAPDADLVLVDLDTSRRHLEVRRTVVGVEVRDLGSKNGSTLAGHELGQRFRKWPHGALLVLADTTLSCVDPMQAALEALTAAPDEPIDADALIDGPLPPTPPPVVAPRVMPSTATPTPAPPSPSADETQRRAPTPAPPPSELVAGADHVDSEPLPLVAEPSPAPARVKAPERRPSNAIDLAVAGFAVVVIAASALGLWWLTRLP